MFDLQQAQRLLLQGLRVDQDALIDNGPLLVPDGMHLEDLERFSESPRRHRGRFFTGYLEDFLHYLSANVDDDETCNPHVFIAGSGALEPPTCEAIFDFGDGTTPAWREHRAILSLESGPAFAALAKLAKQPAVDQQALLDFLDDWPECCTFFRPDGSEVGADVARREFAELTLEKVRTSKSTHADFQRERSAMERLTMGSGLPNRLTFRCMPWAGLSVTDVKVRLSAKEGPNGVGIALSLIGWAKLYEELLEQLVQMISSAAGEVKVLRGVFQSTPN